MSISLEKLAAEEKQRIEDILATFQVDENRKKLLEPVIENTAWMKAKLDETREAIKSSKVAIAYDNGGGQKGIRENPLFKGYEALWKSYLTGVSKILDQIPMPEATEAKEQIGKPETVLELVRNRKKKIS